MVRTRAQMLDDLRIDGGIERRDADAAEQAARAHVNTALRIRLQLMRREPT